MTVKAYIMTSSHDFLASHPPVRFLEIYQLVQLWGALVPVVELCLIVYIFWVGEVYLYSDIPDLTLGKVRLGSFEEEWSQDGYQLYVYSMNDVYLCRSIPILTLVCRSIPDLSLGKVRLGNFWRRRSEYGWIPISVFNLTEWSLLILKCTEPDPG